MVKAATVSRISNDERARLRLWLRLLSTSNLIEQHIRGRLRSEFGITLPQFDVLSELERAGEAQTMSALSQRLLVSNGNITGVVDRLEREGLVRRRPAARDRRVLYIELTAKGGALFQRMAKAHQAWLTALFNELPPDDISQLSDRLGQLKRTVVAAGGEKA